MLTEKRTDGRGHQVWVKIPATDGDRRRLERERTVLGTARHPGVVQVVDLELGEGLALQLVAGELPRSLPPPEVAGLGSAVATTLADLHELGVAHRAVCADHILLDAGGRPVLCSFGHASMPGDESVEAAQREDVAALRHTLVDLIDGEDRTLTRILTKTSGRRMTARVLADSLAGVPDARLPGTAPGSSTRNEQGVGTRPPGRRPPSWRVAGIALMTAAVGAGLLMLVAHRSHPERSTAAFCPGVDRGCGPIDTKDGSFATAGGTWSVGQGGDVVVLGRWSCTGVAFPALLEPATGQVWVFDRWAAAMTDVAGRLVATVPGARTLSVVPRADGCDRLAVVTATGGHHLVGEEVRG